MKHLKWDINQYPVGKMSEKCGMMFHHCSNGKVTRREFTAAELKFHGVRDKFMDCLLQIVNVKKQCSITNYLSKYLSTIDLRL